MSNSIIRVGTGGKKVFQENYAISQNRYFVIFREETIANKPLF